MNKIAFGFNQIRKETPLVITRIKRAIIFIQGAILLDADNIAAAFHTSTAKVSTALGLSLILVNVLAIMCGMKPDEKESQ